MDASVAPGILAGLRFSFLKLRCCKGQTENIVVTCANKMLYFWGTFLLWLFIIINFGHMCPGCWHVCESLLFGVHISTHKVLLSLTKNFLNIWALCVHF